MQQLARGAASRTLVPVEAPAVFEEAIELEYPIVLLEPLAFLLNRLLEQVCARLAARALNAQELRLTLALQNLAGVDPQLETFGIPSESDALHNEAHAPARHFISGRQSQFCRTLRLPLPMLDAKLFLKLLQLDLNAHPPGAPIQKIHLAAEPARPRSAQGDLFLPPSPEPEKLELTLARIAGLVGEPRVGSVELLDTHRAEGFRMRRFTPEAAPKIDCQKAAEKKICHCCSSLVPSTTACHRDFGERRTGASRVLEEKRSAGQCALENRPVAQFRRLVGAGSMGARRVGHRFAKCRQCRSLPARARSARRKLVRGRHV